MRAAERGRWNSRGGCAARLGRIFVYAHMSPASSPTDLLLTISEPTRLRILNCLAAAPLFVSDLQVILGLPQPTVSRHLRVLKEADIVRDTPIAQFVLYRLRRDGGVRQRLLTAVLEAVGMDEQMKTERHQAADRSRSNPRVRMVTHTESMA
jgi:DNA-binding transcriptional ArsR family regulator